MEDSKQKIKRRPADDICYHHFSLTFNPNDLSERFKQVRFVLVAGSAQRAEAQARYLAETCASCFKTTGAGSDGNLSEPIPSERHLERLTQPASRFVLFKVGSVLVSDHGMGAASMSIALHELFLMCQQANIMDRITLIRFGTCGGIGVAPGTICVTKRALDPLFQDFIELKICGKLVRRNCTMDLTTANLLEQLALSNKSAANALASSQLGEFQIRSGTTIGTNDFYEEQCRTNGSICDHSQADKMRFLEEAHSKFDVINMEMESNYLAAMCHKLGVSFGIICVALNNRLLEDTVKLTHAEMSLFERRLFWLNALFIEYTIAKIA